ncbi:MAG TPA: endonuclease/exonuclease/phosphatase family protein [Phycisphaerales bacterium]|nr:endonuclease/exonuclease/phosphatase family protein [Phycisphaerales bacterium]
MTTTYPTTRHALLATILFTAALLTACAGQSPEGANTRTQPRAAVAIPSRTEHRPITRDAAPAPTSTPAPTTTTAAAAEPDVPPPPAPTFIDPPGTIVLDGSITDWPSSTVALSTASHAYVRFMVADQLYTLQAADRTTSIMLDADSDASTGKPVTLGAQTIGVDIEAQFTPRNDNGKLGRGVAVFAFEPDADAQRLTAYDWDFSCTPTYSSDWYEARISRTPKGPVPCTKKGLLSSGTSRGAIATLDATGTPDAWSPIFTIDNQPAAPAATLDASLPAKPANAVRVVSYNVLRSSPNAKPQVFQRVLGALQPDVVLVQEWEAQSESELADWFNSMLPLEGGNSWNVAAIADTVQNGGGVAIVSKFPLLSDDAPRPTVPAGAANAGKPIRAAIALADGPHGPIMFCSTHLKSGGSAGSSEDIRRNDEARALNAIFSAKAPKDAWRIIAGDMNLVGSREPLEVLAAAIDNDNSALTPAPTRTLGDATYLTWSESGNAFAPGRLDWLLYSDSTAKAANAFVLDTVRLSDATLARTGLTATDTAEATDHMPVVVDLVPLQ